MDKERRRIVGQDRYALLQLSVVVKIVLFTALVYLFALGIYLIFKWLFFLSLPEVIWGVGSNWILLAGQIIILAAATAIATKIFLGDPISRMKKAIDEVGRGDLLAMVEQESYDEIGDLAGHFNQMLTRLTELNSRNKTNEDLELMVKDFSLLYEIGQRINSTIEMSELYRVLEDVLPRRLDLQKFALLLVDDRQEFLNIKSAYGFENSERIYDLSFRMGEGISGEVVLTGRAEYLPDVEAERRFLHYQGESIEKGSFLSIPLRFKRRVLGVMNCSRAAKSAFKEEEIRLLTMVANQIASAVENAKLYTKTRELAVRDELTGLYNRRHFQQVLQMEWKRATRFRRPLSLLMIDVDHFKSLNDTFGHIYGDEVLKIISNLLIRNLREVDTVARFGGEEFVILLTDTDKTGALVVGEKLRRLVEAERFDEGRDDVMPLTISAGVSAYPEDAREMDDLIDHADVALYEAKDMGRNTVVSYSDVVELSNRLEDPRLTS